MVETPCRENDRNNTEQKTMRHSSAFCQRAIALAVAVSLLLGCVNCQRNEANPTGNDSGRPDAIPVEVVEVPAASFSETVRAIGTLRAISSVEISPEIPAILTEIHFEEGEPVEEGSLLFSLDDRKLIRELNEREEALTAAQARLKNAERDFERTKQLVESRAVPESEWDTVQTNLETAQAEVRRIEASIALIEERLADTKIRAPFSGITTECLVDPGDYVRPGDHLVTVHTLTPIEMSAKIPERYMGHVRKGQQAELLVAAYPDRRFPGEVTFVSSVVDEQTRDYLIKITVDNPEGRLKPGAFATALLTLRTLENRPAVPEEALVATSQGYSVFVVENGVAKMREVRVGLRETGMAEITSGLQVGEVVVRAGHMRLSDGDAVEVIGGAAQQSEGAPEDVSASAGRAGPPQEESQQ